MVESFGCPAFRQPRLVLPPASSRQPRLEVLEPRAPNCRQKPANVLPPGSFGVTLSPNYAYSSGLVDCRCGRYCNTVRYLSHTLLRANDLVLLSGLVPLSLRVPLGVVAVTLQLLPCFLLPS